MLADRGARAADVRMPGGDDDIAVFGDVDLRGGFAAGIEPEAGSPRPCPAACRAVLNSADALFAASKVSM